MKKQDAVIMTDDAKNEKVIIEGKFDSSKAWISLFVLSVALLLSAVLMMAGERVPECVVLCVLAFFLSFAGMFFCKRDERVEFYITENFIYRKNFFARQSVISVDALRAVELMSFGTIMIITSYGSVSCSMLSNCTDVFEVLVNLINENNNK